MLSQLQKPIIKFNKIIIMPTRLGILYNRRSSKIKLIKNYQFFQEIHLKSLQIIIALKKELNYYNLNLDSIDHISFSII